MQSIYKALVALLCSASLTVVGQVDDPRAKKIVSGVCFLCHGMEGESASEVFPKLAAQHWEYIAGQLDNFKSGKRKSSAMADMAAKLTSEEMVALGQYFESKSTPVVEAKDPDLAMVGRYIFFSGNKFSGVPACASCHGKDARGTASLPRLAGQYASYIESQLKLFSKRERTNDNAVMGSIANNLTPLEMAAVAEYLSGQ